MAQKIEIGCFYGYTFNARLRTYYGGQLSIGVAPDMYVELTYNRVDSEGRSGKSRLVIQAVLGDDDYQDIATIELQKFSEDEDIYGPDYIIEPSEETASLSSYYSMAVFVSVHLWRPVRPLFVPGRVVFVSACSWRARPIWFRPRPPIAGATHRSRAAGWHSPHMHQNKNQQQNKQQQQKKQQQKKR